MAKGHWTPFAGARSDCTDPPQSQAQVAGSGARGDAAQALFSAGFSLKGNIQHSTPNEKMMGRCGSNALPGMDGILGDLGALAVPIRAESVDRIFEPAHAGCHVKMF